MGDFEHDFVDEDDCENADYDYPEDDNVGDHDETNYDPYAGQDVYEIEPLDAWD